MHNHSIELAKYRLQQAKNDYEGAVKCYGIEEYKIANNRSYYSVFHAMRSVLALDTVDFKKHSGVIAYFREHYIKTGIIDKSCSDIINSTSFIRNKSDYEDFYLASKDETLEQIENAKYFYDMISKYVGQQIECG